MTGEADTIKAHCNRCGGEKNHRVLHHQRDEWREDMGTPEEPGPIQRGFEDYNLLRCCGCDSVSLRHESWCNDYGDESAVSYYPPARSRRLPQWIGGMDGLRFIMSQTFVPKLLRQIYSAYHSRSYALAAMGIRALVEQVLKERSDLRLLFGSRIDRNVVGHG